MEKLTKSDVEGKIEAYDKLTLLRFYLLNREFFDTELLQYWSQVVRSKSGTFTTDDVFGSRAPAPVMYQSDGVPNQADLLKSHSIEEIKLGCRKLNSVIHYRRAFPLTPESSLAYGHFEDIQKAICR